MPDVSLKTELKLLEKKASDISWGQLFPMPSFTPKRQEVMAIEVGRDLMQLIERADAAGETGISKQAVELAKSMREVVLEARSNKSSTAKKNI